MIHPDVQREKAARLLSLHHQKEPLVLPNIWEPLGAALLEDLGYPAVATSSSAVALTRGFADGENISFNSLLGILKSITDTVSVPVTADIEKGYARDDEELGQNIEALLDTGISGINFEDGDKQSGGLVSIERQCARIKLIKMVAAKKNAGLVLNARTDTYIHSNLFSGSEEQLAETIRRGKAYREAGADCFFPILIKDKSAINAVVNQVSLPVNIMTIPGIPSFDFLIKTGVKRISLGSSFLKIALQAMKQEALLLKDFKGQEFLEQNKITSKYLETLISK